MPGKRQQRYIGKAAFVLPFFLASSPALAKDVELSAISPWHMDWTESTCVLRRAFGSEQDVHTVSFERFAPGDEFQLIIIGSELRNLDLDDPLWIRYPVKEPEKHSNFLLGKNGKGTPSIFIANSSFGPLTDDGDTIGDVLSETEKAVTHIALEWAGKTVTLLTGAMDKPFAAMRECTRDLVSTWGLDPKQQANLSRRPQPRSDPASWLRSRDYPRGALNSGKQSLVNLRLSIGADGQVTDCKIQRSYSGEEFDERTCSLLRERAEFEPALDAQGNPVASYFATTVTYVMAR